MLVRGRRRATPVGERCGMYFRCFVSGMQPVMYSTRAAEERGVGWVRAGTNVAYYQVRGVGEQDHRVRA